MRKIGKLLSEEIEKRFDTKVNPVSIAMKASRLKAVTNVTPQENATNSDGKAEIKQIKREPAKDGTMRGGPREGSGRKPKEFALSNFGNRRALSGDVGSEFILTTRL